MTMYGVYKQDSLKRCCVMHITVISVVISVTVCFNPCPESERGSAASRLPQIPDKEVENAFRKAEKIVQQRRLLEEKLVAQGRIIPRSAITAESNHQPISEATPIVRDLENRQLRFYVASVILQRKYRLTPAQVSCGLPTLPLNGPEATRALEICTANMTEVSCDSQDKYRTVDGTCNNLNNPTWGSALGCADRILRPAYTGHSRFRRSARGGYLPFPRKLSLNVHTSLNRSATNVNHMHMFFGQLLDHDLTSTSQSTTVGAQTIECCPAIWWDHPQCAPIFMRRDDPFYSQFGTRCFNFVRTAHCRYCTLGPRCQVDAVTAFIDVSFAYGNSQGDRNITRRYDGSGTLKMRPSEFGDLLPPSYDLSSDRCSRPQQNKICFQSGDARVNQHPLLTSLHTLFHREHNRVATELRFVNPHWDDDTLFEEARRIVGAEMQVIVYKEYLPVTIGEEHMSQYNLQIDADRSTYNPDMDATMRAEFSTAAFRFGHGMINSMINEDPKTPGHSGHLLRDTFIYPFHLYNGEMDPLLRGVTESPANEFNRHMVQDVTNFLYRVRGHPAGLDLAAINIQRGRDNGLQGYTVYAKYCSQENVNIKTFADLSRHQLMAPETVRILDKNYKCVQDIDLFTGLLSEIPLKGAVVGPTAACIIGLQFQRLKYGDRFFFQHADQPGSFTNEQIAELKKASLSKIICGNTRITEMQRQAVLFSGDNNPVLPCLEIPGINITAWKQSP